MSFEKLSDVAVCEIRVPPLIIISTFFHLLLASASYPGDIATVFQKSTFTNI